METYRATGAVIQEVHPAKRPGIILVMLAMKDARVWMLQNFTIWFQNAAEPSQCVAQLDALYVTLE